MSNKNSTPVIKNIPNEDMLVSYNSNNSKVNPSAHKKIKVKMVEAAENNILLLNNTAPVLKENSKANEGENQQVSRYSRVARNAELREKAKDNEYAEQLLENDSVGEFLDVNGDEEKGESLVDELEQLEQLGQDLIKAEESGDTEMYDKILKELTDMQSEMSGETDFADFESALNEEAAMALFINELNSARESGDTEMEEKAEQELSDYQDLVIAYNLANKKGDLSAKNDALVKLIACQEKNGLSNANESEDEAESNNIIKQEISDEAFSRTNELSEKLKLALENGDTKTYKEIMEELFKLEYDLAVPSSPNPIAQENINTNIKLSQIDSKAKNSEKEEDIDISEVDINKFSKEKGPSVEEIVDSLLNPEEAEKESSKEKISRNIGGKFSKIFNKFKGNKNKLSVDDIYDQINSRNAFMNEKDQETQRAQTLANIDKIDESIAKEKEENPDREKFINKVGNKFKDFSAKHPNLKYLAFATGATFAIPLALAPVTLAAPLLGIMTGSAAVAASDLFILSKMLNREDNKEDKTGNKSKNNSKTAEVSARVGESLKSKEEFFREKEKLTLDRLEEEVQDKTDVERSEWTDEDGKIDQKKAVDVLWFTYLRNNIK